MLPQNISRGTSTTFPAQDARLLQYQDVLGKISTNNESGKYKKVPAENNLNVSDGWMSEDEEVEESKGSNVKTADVGPLLGGFADAETAMA